MKAPAINSKQVDVRDQIRALIEEHKRCISIVYSELKLRLPSYLKAPTIAQLRELGAIVDPGISLPRGADDRIRKFVSLNEKVKEVRELYIARVTKYYDDIKKALPKELLDKKLDDLTDEEWSQLGINMPMYRAKYPKITIE